MSLENDLLKAADELEKTAMEMENNMYLEKKTEGKKEESKESKESKEEGKEAKSEEKSEESKKAKSKEEDEKDAKAETVAALKEELGLSDDELAEKVASADPSVVEYIKNLSQVSVESMGGSDTREKTASSDDDDDSDPFGDFLRTPL